MSAPAWILLASILVSLGVLIAMGIGLAREGMRVARTGMDFARGIAPVTDQLSAEADRAARHAAQLGERAAAIRS